MDMKPAVKQYLARIGRKGGQMSRRSLSPMESASMLKVREARRAFRLFFFQCFWSCDQAYRVRLADVPWVAEQLMKYGDRRAWEFAERLCH